MGHQSAQCGSQLGAGECEGRYRKDRPISRPEVKITIEIVGGERVPRNVVVAGL